MKLYALFCLFIGVQTATAQSPNWLIKPQFDSIYMIQKTYFGVVKNKKHGIVSIDNTVLVPLIFDDLHCPYADEPFIVGVKKNNLWGFTKQNGEVIIPFQFEKAADFKKNGLAAVAKNKKWGFVNTKGQIVIDFQYTFTSGFVYGETALVGIITDSTAEQWQINAQNKRMVEADQGNEVKEIFQDNLKIPERAQAFFENGKYGLKKGNQVISQPKYENMYAITSSYRAFLVFINGKYGCVNDEGEDILKAEFEAMLTNGFDWVAVKQNGLWGIAKVVSN